MFSKQIRIQFVDTDASKRIHYSAVLRYFEQLDHEFLRSIGYSYKRIFQEGLELPRIHLECIYLGSLEYDDVIDASVEIEKIGKTSFTYQFLFMKDQNLVLKGKLTVVFIQADTGKKIDIPEEIRGKLEDYVLSYS